MPSSGAKTFGRDVLHGRGRFFELRGKGIAETKHVTPPRPTGTSGDSVLNHARQPLKAKIKKESSLKSPLEDSTIFNLHLP